MTDIQKALLEMVGWFHLFCEKNKITYYIVAGTMLGAVRHKGFIPWDDDLDVVIPRPDYEKLIRMSSQIGDDYYLETPYSPNDDFYFTYSKIYKKSTTLIEKSKHRCVRGLYIDVFPLDGIGKTKKESIENFKKTDKYRVLYNARCRSIERGKPFSRNLAIAMASCIPHFLIDERKMQKKIDLISKRVSFTDSKFVANIHTPYRFKEIMNKKIYGTPTLYEFEGISLFGVERYDEYLRHLYGDYRKLPPIEKRVTHHDYEYLSLDKGFEIHS